MRYEVRRFQTTTQTGDVGSPNESKVRESRIQEGGLMNCYLEYRRQTSAKTVCQGDSHIPVRVVRDCIGREGGEGKRPAVEGFEQGAMFDEARGIKWEKKGYMFV